MGPDYILGPIDYPMSLFAIASGVKSVRVNVMLFMCRLLIQVVRMDFTANIVSQIRCCRDGREGLLVSEMEKNDGTHYNTVRPHYDQVWR